MAYNGGTIYCDSMNLPTTGKDSTLGHFIEEREDLPTLKRRISQMKAFLYNPSTGVRIVLFFCILSLSSISLAQLPYQQGTEHKKAAPEPKAQSQQESIGLFLHQWQHYMGSGSPYRPVIITVVTLIVLLNLKAYLTKVMRKHVKEKAFRKENATHFMKVWNSVWKFVIAILVIVAMSGSLRLLGLTAGFFGMMLGWSLQQPVTGLAAWLMIILKKPFRIGDRVVIAGITGDVTSISLTHVVLNQVGGSVGGEERSGRGILIPNAILFQNTIINYTFDQKYMLDEVPVRLTFDSDWDEAKRIMIEVATEVTKKIIAETNQAPFIRAEFLDWGILVRLRYNTIAVERQEISTRIVEILLREFARAYPRVRFAIPSTHVRYRPDTALLHKKTAASNAKDEEARRSSNHPPHEVPSDRTV
jgi:small-conductance mechanosensitive channel